MKKYLLVVILSITAYSSLAAAKIINLIMPVSYLVADANQSNLLKNYLSQYQKASIVGASGSGKTQLARNYAYQNHHQYNLIWFIDCNLDLGQEFIKLARQINQTAGTTLPEDAAQAQKAVMDYLADQQQWLLVLDNLKIGQNKLVTSLISWQHGGQVIFCSQDSRGLPGLVQMTEFKQLAAAVLAKKLLEGHNQEDIDFLVTSLQGSPILIVQSAQLLNQLKGRHRTEYKNAVCQATDKVAAHLIMVARALKPSAVELLCQLALLNNQQLSKEMIMLITGSLATAEDDIDQLSTSKLIANIDAGTGQIFEMHDAIAQKVLALNEPANNKLLLEDMMLKIAKYYHRPLIKGAKDYVFRVISTDMSENLAVILKHAQQYQVDIGAEMCLKGGLFFSYIFTGDRPSCELMIDWLNKHEKNTDFSSIWDNQIYIIHYAVYLGMIGSYNYHQEDFQQAVNYYTRASTALEKIHNTNQALKNGLLFSCSWELANSQAFLGNITEAEITLSNMAALSAQQIIDKNGIMGLCHAKTVIYQMQGKYLQALECLDEYIENLVKSGTVTDDVSMTITYKFKIESLNWLGKYQQAENEARQLNRYRQAPADDRIFGFIYTQAARSALGLGQVKAATGQIKQAISILLADDRRKPQSCSIRHNADLASAYLVQGDILVAQGNLREAVASYLAAQVIYSGLYGANSKNIAHVSYLYTQAAKAACQAKASDHYRYFSQLQIKEFGLDHPGTVQMLKYCRPYNISLPAR